MRSNKSSNTDSKYGLWFLSKSTFHWGVPSMTIQKALLDTYLFDDRVTTVVCLVHYSKTIPVQTVSQMWAVVWGTCHPVKAFTWKQCPQFWWECIYTTPREMGWLKLSHENVLLVNPCLSVGTFSHIWPCLFICAAEIPWALRQLSLHKLLQTKLLILTSFCRLLEKCFEVANLLCILWLLWS